MENLGDTQTLNNRVLLHGTVVGTPRKSHTVFGEEYVDLALSVSRLSNMHDLIPITLHQDQIREHAISEGIEITVKGQFRSYNQIIGDRSKLMLTTMVREVQTDSPAPDNPNIIELTGYICKAPVYRTTPFNREIADVLVAVNRTYNKSDYIPTIAWGRNARATQTMTVGEKIHLTGRIQSREYQKKLDDGTIETRTAFEVSINRLGKEPLESVFAITDKAFTAQSTDLIEEISAM